MLFYLNWIERGFQLVHKPGISRAWVRVESDGRQLILTDTLVGLTCHIARDRFKSASSIVMMT